MRRGTWKLSLVGKVGYDKVGNPVIWGSQNEPQTS